MHIGLLSKGLLHRCYSAVNKLDSYTNPNSIRATTLETLNQVISKNGRNACVVTRLVAIQYSEVALL